MCVCLCFCHCVTQHFHGGPGMRWENCSVHRQDSYRRRERLQSEYREKQDRVYMDTNNGRKVSHAHALIGRFRSGLFRSEKEGRFMPNIVPNSVHVHANLDPVSDYLHCARVLRLCDAFFRCSAGRKQRSEPLEHTMKVYITRKSA